MNFDTMNNVIDVKDICEKYNDFSRSGKEIFLISKPLIEKDETIVFNMKGLDSVSTVFLNASFGNLIDIFGLEKVKHSFRFTNILRSQVERIKKYFSDYEEISTSY